MFQAGCFHFCGWNVLNLFLFPRLTLAMSQRRRIKSTIKIHYFISFILFLSSSAHRQPLGGVLQKSHSVTVLKPIKKFDQKIPAKEFNFSLKVHASSLQLYWSWTPSHVFFIDFEHRCSCILCRLATLKNTYSNIFAERLQWLLLNITSILLIGSIQSFKEL